MLPLKLYLSLGMLIEPSYPYLSEWRVRLQLYGMLTALGSGT